jgi:NADPH-dependent curcumin reductase CurA
VHGFLVLDFVDQMPEYYKDMFQWKAEGKIEAVVDVKELKFEQVPEGLYSLLKGQNFGKNLVKLVD